VDRLIEDLVPMSILTRARIKVTGDPREELIKGLLLPESIPVSLDSPLQARLVDEGLRIQVRPGVFDVYLRALVNHETKALGPIDAELGVEHWAFSQEPSFRQVEIGGAKQVDATRLEIPWRNYPIYEMDKGSSLEFTVLRRGDPDPGPNRLELNRSCWLDYGGGGLSCRDDLRGTIRRDWKITLDPPFKLGQASLNGVPQVITKQKNKKGEDSEGLQLRQGALKLTADLRVEDFKGIIPASGWDQDLMSSFQSLNLPPGYSLFYAKGPKAYELSGHPASFWDGWTTLDLFIVILIIFATYRLIGKPYAILAALAMIISYHEFLCPRLVILHILAALAILKVLSKDSGRARVIVKIWKFIASLFLVSFVIVFIMLQLRYALYPQIKNPNSESGGFLGYPVSRAFNVVRNLGAPDTAYSPQAELSRAYDDSYVEDSLSESQALYDAESLPPPELSAPGAAAPAAMDSKTPQRKAQAPRLNQVLLEDKLSQNSQISLQRDEKVQNSFPRPSWSWKRILLHYNGEVSRDQEASLIILPPIVNKLLGFARAILMALFALVLLGRGPKEGGGPVGLRDFSFFHFSFFHPVGKGKPKSEALEDSQEPNAKGGPKPLIGLVLPLLFGLSFLIGSLYSSPLKAQNSFPSPELLEELSQRLSKIEEVPPPSVPFMEIDASEGEISFIFHAESASEAFLPLPSLDDKIFQPLSAALKNGSDLPVVAFSGNQRLVLIPAGISEISYKGKLKDAPSFQLLFQNKLKPKRVLLRTPLLSVSSGLNRDGYLTGQSLVLSAVPAAGTRNPGESGAGQGQSQGGQAEEGQAGQAGQGGQGGDEGDAGEAINSPAPAAGAAGAGSGAGAGALGGSQSVISPFFKVQRTVSLGATKELRTEAVAIMPLDAPYTLSLPLLPGERPMSQEVTVSGDKILLNFSASNPRISFASSLELKDDSLTLSAGKGPYSEEWILDAANLWSVSLEGIAPVYNMTREGFWNPRWFPWPGESLSLRVSEPEAIQGMDVVSDKASLSVVAGEENRRNILDMFVRTSSGKNMGFRLPKGAKLVSLSVNDNPIPFSADGLAEDENGDSGPLLNLPLNPGNNSLKVVWLEDKGATLITRTPALDPGLLSANVDLTLDLPQSRWVLFAGGPFQGPAILFWSFCLYILVLALVLSHLRLTPLKTLSWFFFLLGLSQLSVVCAMITGGWLLLLGLRGKRDAIKNPALFNLTQIGLLILSALSLYLIYRGLNYGLLEAPNMRVTGNNSYGNHLRWFQDRSQGAFPEAWAFGIPNRIYQYLMLVWALWLAVSFISWLRWGWRAFSSGAIWKKSLPPQTPPPGPKGPGGGWSAPPRGPAYPPYRQGEGPGPQWPPQGPPPQGPPPQGPPPQGPPPQGPPPPPPQGAPFAPPLVPPPGAFSAPYVPPPGGPFGPPFIPPPGAFSAPYVPPPGSPLAPQTPPEILGPEDPISALLGEGPLKDLPAPDEAPLAGVGQDPEGPISELLGEGPLKDLPAPDDAPKKDES
jgi:hypothetical protein